MSQYSWATCPTPTRDQVERVVALFAGLLGADLAGTYLHGSLAMGCFNPRRSDLDLLVVGQRALTLDQRKLAIEGLLRLSGAPHPIEISALTQSDLRPWRHPAPYDLHYSEAWRELADGSWRRWGDAVTTDPDLAAHVTIVRRRGVCLSGAPIASVFPLVPPREYWDAIWADARESLAAVERHPVSVVLNACRVAAYARDGLVLSKDEGGQWALSALPEEWHRVVSAALASYRDGDRAMWSGDDPRAFAVAMLAWIAERSPAV